jgi:apolipoprotein N-acyltransferase
MARTDPLIIVQGNVPQALKNERQDPRAAQVMFDDHRRLTREAYETLLDERRTPLAVLWPETMIPWPFLDPGLARRFPAEWANQQVVLESLRSTAPPVLDDMGVPLLFLVGVARHLEGATGRHETLEAHDVTDSLQFLDARRVGTTVEIPPAEAAGWRAAWDLGVHHKTVLVPWGEYAPGSSWLPVLRRVRDALSVIPEITPGEEAQEPFLLTWAPPNHPGGPNRAVRVGTIVCFELAFPARCRAWRQQGATVLVNPGNYAWYGDSAMPSQVEALARLRAAELAVTVAVAGNTGPSCVVDPTGTVRARVSQGGRRQFVEGWCASPLWSDAELRTVYLRVGDTPWLVLGALLGLGAAWAARHRRVTGRSSPGEGAWGPPSVGSSTGGVANPSESSG